MIWRYLPIAPPTSLEDMRAYVEDALKTAEAGSQVPFAIIHKETNQPIGSTRYLDIQRENSALEIGWTWIGKPWQRTAVNTQCKFQLLRHAFEDLGAIRVQLKTDGRNEQSQRAIERLGAKKEGVLRRSRRLWDGFVRDTVVYSILAEEWPAVREGLVSRGAGVTAR